MTMAYFASFDTVRGGAGTVTLATPGKTSIVINLTTFWTESGAVKTTFNHWVNAAFSTFGPYGELPLKGVLPSQSFLSAIQTTAQAQATTLAWASPGTISVGFNTTTWRVTFAYPTGFSAINFSNTETRRLFGFAGNFSGASSSVVGTETPKYVIIPTINGASSASIIYEDDATSSNASSAGGRPYGLSRSGTMRRREWVQQYESKARTYRMFAAAPPNEFTYQHLFEACRTGLPFGVYEGFDPGENPLHAYQFRPNAESFRAKPATPGNANQFHIPFDTFAIGRF